MSSSLRGASSSLAVSPVDARARELRACATRRWLVKDELVFLLLHHRQQTAIPCLRSLQRRPTSGALLFYDTNDVADFKKDGWQWQKRKDNSGRVREDRAKLVINREVIILGTYVHSAEIPTFHRRNYYLRDSNSHVILVHYFDEVHKIDPGMGALVPSRSQPLPSMRSIAAASTTAVSSSKGIKRALLTSSPVEPQPFSPHPPIKMDPYDDSRPVDVIMKDCFEMDFHANQHSPQPHLLASNGSLPHYSHDDDEALFSDLNSLLSPASSHEMSGGTMAAHEKLVEISDFSPDWDFVCGGAKILICLASPLPSSTSPETLFVQFGSDARASAERISDAVIRCSAPSSMAPGNVDLFVCLCSSTSSADCVQVSTTRSFQYKSVMTSPVPTPVFADENVLAQVEGLRPVQVVNATPGKRGRSPVTVANVRRFVRRNSSDSRPPEGRRWSNPDCINLSSFVDTDLDERQCKIRVVERLAEFQDAIRTTSSTGADSETQHESNSAEAIHRGAEDSDANETASDGGSSVALDDGAIEALSDQDLESLSERLIENVVRQLITVAHTSEELLDELNSLDETGLSLLHFVSFYNYSNLIPLLLTHGAQVNQQSTQGHTPLHLAAGCGHEQVVEKLIEAGADLFQVDFDGYTPAERAEKSEHPAVAQRLRRLMSETAMQAFDDAAEGDFSHSDLWSSSMTDMEVDDEDGHVSAQSSHERLAATPESTSVDGDLDSSFNGGELVSAVQSSLRTTSYFGENQEHNRKLLLGAFSTMSLHDKCALSLSISRDLSTSYGTSNAKRRGSSISDDSVAAMMFTGSSSASSPSKGTDGLNTSTVTSVTGCESDSIGDSDVKSVIADDEENLYKLEAAMELMGPEELQSLEEEARVIQHNVRAWLLRRNCRNMRETTKRLHAAAKSIEDQQKHKQHQDERQRQAAERELMSQQEMSERERAAVTVQAAARSMLARKSFLQTRNVTIKVQAATRGVLCRKNFARMKSHALASLVIQRNVREWLSKQPNGGRPPSDSYDVDSHSHTNSHTNSAVASPAMFEARNTTTDAETQDADDELMRELTAALEPSSSSSFLS